MNNKILFIIPYFGRFHNYFQLWLHSCKYNHTIDWLILTDDKTAYDYPKNVKVVYTTFQEIVKQIQRCYDFKIVLPNPYLLCEFRIAYGEIFSNYAEGYGFWGYCDTDVIWGNLRQHFSDDILNTHSKISWRGHLTLFRNHTFINALYKNDINGLPFYKDAFSNTTGFPLASDERQINNIFLNAGEKIYKELLFADLKIRSHNFFLLHFPPSVDYKNLNQVFLWQKGNLYRLYVENGTVFKENFAYIHFLKRPMSVGRNFVIGDSFLIIPNKFINTETFIDKALIEANSTQKVYISYFLSRFSLNYILSKIRYFNSRRLLKKKYPTLPLGGFHTLLPEQIKRKIF